MKYKTSQECDFIFCGLVRIPEMFKKSINDLLKLKKESLVGKIIFSTWKGEVDKYPGLRDFLVKNKIDLIESKEPNPRGFSNIWCQMVSLENGLKIVKNQNKFILKSRPDVYISPSFLKNLFSNKENLLKITHNLSNGNVFKYKVWVPWYELKRPFFMADECFFGHASDVRLLVNYESFNEAEIGAGVTHIRRFVHPFLEKYPELKSSLTKYRQISSLRRKTGGFSNKFFNLSRILPIKKISELDRRIYFNKSIINNKKYLRALAIYYSILHSHFYIDSLNYKNQVVFREWSKPAFSPSLNNLRRNFVTETDFFLCGDRTFVYNEDVINNFFNKNMKDRLSAELLRILTKSPVIKE